MGMEHYSLHESVKSAVTRREKETVTGKRALRKGNNGGQSQIIIRVWKVMQIEQRKCRVLLSFIVISLAMLRDLAVRSTFEDHKTQQGGIPRSWGLI